jgi:NADH-quinone oxidoreductase subunit E
MPKDYKEELSHILKSSKGEKRELISLLQKVQEKIGYVSLEAMAELAHFLKIPPSTVYGVATFYNQFRFTPIGRHPVKVCLGTACHTWGGKLVLEAMERELETKVGGITLDGEFSLDRVACIGCCVIAPVIVIDKDVYPKMTPLKVEEVLGGFKQTASSANPPSDENG